jgi:hypothetical protein
MRCSPTAACAATLRWRAALMCQSTLAVAPPSPAASSAATRAGEVQRRTCVEVVGCLLESCASEGYMSSRELHAQTQARCQVCC